MAEETTDRGEEVSDDGEQGVTGCRHHPRLCVGVCKLEYHHIVHACNTLCSESHQCSDSHPVSAPFVAETSKKKKRGGGFKGAQQPM